MNVTGGPAQAFVETETRRTPSSRFIERPTLIWPSIPQSFEDQEYDRKAVPHQTLTDKRHEYCLSRQQEGRPGLGCKAFWETAASSRKLLILDSHFDWAAMIALREELGKGRGSFSDLRVICSERAAHKTFDDLKRQLRNRKRIEPDCTIGMCCVRKGEPPYIHDRFAVTDNELWHFGGTVGGLHQDLTAVSRGWDASNHRFLYFFDELWKELARGYGGSR